MERLRLKPIKQEDAFAFVTEHHRHLKRPTGSVFQIAATRGSDMVGVIIVGRPTARGYDDGLTAQVLRCTTDGSKNVPSFLYGAAARAARALGYSRLVTYTFEFEDGVSLKAAGFEWHHDVYGRSWDSPGRPRQGQFGDGFGKVCWEKRL